MREQRGSMIIRLCDKCKTEMLKIFPVLIYRTDAEESTAWDLCVSCAASLVAELGNGRLSNSAHQARDWKGRKSGGIQEPKQGL